MPNKPNSDKPKPKRLPTTDVTDSTDNIREERIYSGIIFVSEVSVVGG